MSEQEKLNNCRSWLRKRWETTSFEDIESVYPGLSPAEILERAETQRLVRCALERLTEKNRLVIVLRYLGGLSYRDIARFLDVPLRTVEGRMHRARQQLKGHVMKKVEDTLKSEQLSNDFARQVLDEAVEKAKTAQKGWAKEDFMRSCQEALYVAHARHGAFDKMKDRAQEALARFEVLGDRENAAQARAAMDLAENLPGVWQPGQKGGYAMAAFPVRTGEEGIEFLDPKSVRNYSWGCPSRCTALAHVLRPRRLNVRTIRSSHPQGDSSIASGYAW